MVVRENLRLGQKVLYGKEREECFVEMLTRTAIGLISVNGHVILCEYGDVYTN